MAMPGRESPLIAIRTGLIDGLGESLNGFNLDSIGSNRQGSGYRNGLDLLNDDGNADILGIIPGEEVS
jgi:hypothetical protein